MSLRSSAQRNFRPRCVINVPENDSLSPFPSTPFLLGVGASYRSVFFCAVIKGAALAVKQRLSVRVSTLKHRCALQIRQRWQRISIH